MLLPSSGSRCKFAFFQSSEGGGEPGLIRGTNSQGITDAEACAAIALEILLHLAALAFAPCCVAVFSLLHRASMHGVLFFTVQRYDITIAVFECFGNFLKNFMWLS